MGVAREANDTVLTFKSLRRRSFIAARLAGGMAVAGAFARL